MVTFVETDYTEPDIRYTLIGTAGGNDPDTGDIYRGLDRFGRIVDSYWYDYGSSTDVDRIKYGYGRSGNRLWRENVVARSLSKEFDELYTYDAIHRLKDMSRGTLDAQHSSLSSTQFQQCWGLDETGNWSNFREDDDGDGSWNLNQNRTANKVNEISDITECTGPSWATPAYSPAGNMTTVPKSADPTTSFTATYDAWNRLTKLVDTTSSDTVAEYEYDGAKRRTIQKSYTGGTLDETRHLYYTEPTKWQVIEERVDSDVDPERQFVWGLRYIDDLILRDRDTTGNGTLDERAYALQDANWGVTALVNTAGTVLQRFAYTAYGTPLFLTSAFATGTDSFGWETLYAGYRSDANVLLYHIRHRAMHPALAFWLQRDPLSLEAVQTQLYDYCSSSPYTCVDPQGLLPIQILVPCPPPAITLARNDCRTLGGLVRATCYDVFVGMTRVARWVKAFCVNTGDCYAGQYRDLRSKKERWCNQPRSCKKVKCCEEGTPRSDCRDINKRIVINRQCIKYRTQIMVRCFSGGDRRHKEERDRVFDDLYHCYLKKRNCKC